MMIDLGLDIAGQPVYSRGFSQSSPGTLSNLSAHNELPLEKIRQTWRTTFVLLGTILPNTYSCLSPHLSTINWEPHKSTINSDNSKLDVIVFFCYQSSFFVTLWRMTTLLSELRMYIHVLLSCKCQTVKFPENHVLLAESCWIQTVAFIKMQAERHWKPKSPWTLWSHILFELQNSWYTDLNPGFLILLTKS